MRLAVFLLIFCSILTYSKNAHSVCRKKIVAVIDTGFGYKDVDVKANLCTGGHKDFSLDQQTTLFYNTKMPVPRDFNGHGTNVVGLINKYAENNTNYCIVVIKYYSDLQDNLQNLSASLKALKYATRGITADVINYSSGGSVMNKEEIQIVKEFLNRGGTFIAAAGNESQNLDLPYNSYYPAMADSRVITVGNENMFGEKSRSSNYGKVVKKWEVGENASAYGITMTGTSQAAAIYSGKFLFENQNRCDIGI